MLNGVGIKMELLDKDIKCTICKEPIPIKFRDSRRYVYKVKQNGLYKYQCSYKCWLEAMERENVKHKKRNNRVI